MAQVPLFQGQLKPTRQGAGATISGVPSMPRLSVAEATTGIRSLLAANQANINATQDAYATVGKTYSYIRSDLGRAFAQIQAAGDDVTGFSKKMHLAEQSKLLSEAVVDYETAIANKLLEIESSTDYKAMLPSFEDFQEEKRQELRERLGPNAQTVFDEKAKRSALSGYVKVANRARTLQVQDHVAAVQGTIDKTSRLAVGAKDPQDLARYMREIDQSLGAAVHSGTITPETARQRFNAAYKTIVTTRIEREADATSAASVLHRMVVDPKYYEGLQPDDREKVINKLEARVRRDRSERRSEAAEARALRKVMQESNYMGILKALQDPQNRGKISEENLWQAAAHGDISAAQRKDLALYMNTGGGSAEAYSEARAILLLANQGKDLPEGVGPGTLDLTDQVSWVLRHPSLSQKQKTALVGEVKAQATLSARPDVKQALGAVEDLLDRVLDSEKFLPDQRAVLSAAKVEAKERLRQMAEGGQKLTIYDVNLEVAKASKALAPILWEHSPGPRSFFGTKRDLSTPEGTLDMMRRVDAAKASGQITPQQYDEEYRKIRALVSLRQWSEWQATSGGGVAWKYDPALEKKAAAQGGK